MRLRKSKADVEAELTAKAKGALGKVKDVALKVADVGAGVCRRPAMRRWRRPFKIEGER